MTDEATERMTDSTAIEVGAQLTDPPLPWEAAQIMRIIPHRYPFLLIDRVLELEVGKRVVAIKGVTANEPQFTGHFPGRPIMPGVLMVALFAGIDDCRFRRTVLPGDTLRIEVTVEKLSRLFGKARMVASVDGEVAVEATLSFIIPRDQSIAGGPAAPSGETDG